MTNWQEYCKDCNKHLKLSGEGSYVHSWKIYCEDCYYNKVKEGKIIPPSHSKILEKIKGE